MQPVTSGDNLPILYTFRRCPYAMRARLAIAVSGLRCELREVVLRDKPAQLIQASPKATVPVLVEPGGRVVDQSLEIMLWALRQRDPQHWLVPPMGDLDAMLALIAECDGEFKQHLDRYKYPQRFENTVRVAQRDAGAQWLHGLNARLEGKGFLFGDRPALADYAILPFVRQYAHTDLDWFQRQHWPALNAALDQWMSSALFDSVMRKYEAWKPGAASVIFPES